MATRAAVARDQLCSHEARFGERLRRSHVGFVKRIASRSQLDYNHAMRTTGPVMAIVFVVTSFALDAQWLDLPTPGLPRLPDGKPDLAAPAPRTPDGKPDFSGVWNNDSGDRYGNNVAADLRVEDVAPWAHALFTKRTLEFGKDSMETRCLPLGPAYTTTRYREYRVVQTPTLIVFLYSDGMHREIFMDGRTLEADPNPTWMGYSVGHWDGDALVVESNGYNDRSWLDFGGHPHTEALRITERFTRPSVGRLERQITMVDPAIYAKPMVVDIQAALMADTEMLEAVCENQEGSRARMALTQAAEPVQVPAETLARYVGTYDTIDNGSEHFVDVTRDGANLYLDYDGKGSELLIALSPTRFSWSGSIVEFTAAADNMNIDLHYVEGIESGVRRK